jgi:hypothetical protein
VLAINFEYDAGTFRLCRPCAVASCPMAVRRLILRLSRELHELAGRMRAPGGLRVWLLHPPGPLPTAASWFRKRWAAFRNPAKCTVTADVEAHTVVGAGSVVLEPLPARCLAAGSPAVVLGYFDA